MLSVHGCWLKGQAHMAYLLTCQNAHAVAVQCGHTIQQQLHLCVSRVPTCSSDRACHLQLSLGMQPLDDMHTVFPAEVNH